MSNTSIAQSIENEQDILNNFKVDKEVKSDEFIAYCPAHNDQNNPNLRITFTHDKVLAKCFACGANGSEVFEAAGIDPKYLYKDNWSSYEPIKFNLENLAQAKNLKVKFLKNLGVKERSGQIVIPYRDREGNHIRDKIRTAMKATNGSRWSGSGDIKLYGLWFLDRMKKKHDDLVLVEGESDSWTLWQHGIAALGVPGANMTGKINRQDIKDFGKIYLWREPDQGGKEFIIGARERLKELNYNGDVYVIDGTDYGIKDPNELHITNSEGFMSSWHDILQGADEIDLNGNMDLFERSEEETTEQEIEWEKPLPFNNYEVDPIPAEVFPQWQQDFIKNISDFIQVAEDMPAMLMLSVTATALANKAVIEVKPGWKEPLNIWTCSILPPAERKSPVFKKFQKPLIEYERREAEKVEQDRKPLINEKSILEDRMDNLKKKAAKTNNATERQSLIQEVNELQAEIDDIYIPPIPRLTASDITSEAVAKLMGQNYGRLSILDPEGTIFKIMAGHYSGNPDLKNFKKAWTGSEPIGDDRMTREGNSVANPALSMGVTTQPSVFETLKHVDQFVGEGVFARLLFAIPERMAGNRLIGEECPDFRHDIYDKYKRGLMVLLNAKPKNEENGEWEPHIIKFTKQARIVRDKFASYIEERSGAEGEFHFMQGWAGKITGNTTRLAGLLEIASRVDPDSGRAIDLSEIEITKKSMQNAAKLGHTLISHAKKLHGELDTDPKISLAKYVLTKVIKGANMEKSGELKEKYDKNSFDKNVLYKLCQGKKKIERPKDLDQPLRLLEESNYIMRVGRESSGGRPPSDLIILNPHLQNRQKQQKSNSNNTFVDIVDIVDTGQASEIEGQMII